MTAEQVVYTQLSASTALSALVGARISPGLAVQGSPRPYVTFHVVMDQPDYAHEGPDSYRYPTVQVDAWADTFDAARNVNDAVVQALFVADSPPVWFFIVESAGEYSFEDDTRLHRFMSTVKVYYR